MAKTFQDNFATRLYNSLVTRLLHAGMPMGPMILLTVRGRKSGVPRTTPVALLAQDGKRYVSSPYGDVNWVQNLRAAGKARLAHGRRVETVTVSELGTKEAAAVLKRTMSAGGFASFFLSSVLKSYYNVTPRSSLEEFEREAPRHPTFLLQRAKGARHKGVKR